MRRSTIAFAIGAAFAATGCGSDALAPAALDTGHDVCAFCRMIVSDRRFASQIVAPLEEPTFFDDLGCLANYLREAGQLPRAVVYVTDHSTLQWVRGDQAVFTRVDTPGAPMGSHVVAHASRETRAADPAARAGTPVGSRELFPDGLPGGPR